jgi:hypothetical protein
MSSLSRCFFFFNLASANFPTCVWWAVPAEPQAYLLKVLRSPALFWKSALHFWLSHTHSFVSLTLHCFSLSEPSLKTFSRAQRSGCQRTHISFHLSGITLLVAWWPLLWEPLFQIFVMFFSSFRRKDKFSYYYFILTRNRGLSSVLKIL